MWSSVITLSLTIWPFFASTLSLRQVRDIYDDGNYMMLVNMDAKCNRLLACLGAFQGSGEALKHLNCLTLCFMGCCESHTCPGLVSKTLWCSAVV
jgi:hypothetical protein